MFYYKKWYDAMSYYGFKQLTKIWCNRYWTIWSRNWVRLFSFFFQENYFAVIPNPEFFREANIEYFLYAFIRNPEAVTTSGEKSIVRVAEPSLGLEHQYLFSVFILSALYQLPYWLLTVIVAEFSDVHAESIIYHIRSINYYCIFSLTLQE